MQWRGAAQRGAAQRDAAQREVGSPNEAGTHRSDSGSHLNAVGILFLQEEEDVKSFATNLFEPIEEISERFAEMQMAQASAERVLGLINEIPEIEDSEAIRGTVPKDDRIRRVELSDVCFSYDSDKHTRRGVLHNINLTANAGETIAIVGPTGGGKTTLVNVIARFFEPSSGAVLINGKDYRQYHLDWLQSRLGVVLQDNHIFSGTLAENIRYARLDASDAEIIHASQLAGADEFIVQMEQQYQTEAGERGNRLSAGQKQLLSFARAIISDPQMVIMDEATSSVDTATEQKIQQGLGPVLEGRIAFVIAHRLSTIRQATHVIYIDDGRIVEQGSHEELLQTNGPYSALYRLQQVEDSIQQICA